MKRILLLTAAALVVSGPALGCAACFGKSDSPMAYGMNAGIMTLLAVIMTVLSLVASFFVFIVRRASRVESGSDFNPPSV